MGLTYSDFLDSYNRNEELNSKIYEISPDWLLNNSTWIIALLAVIFMLFFKYKKITEPVAKNDSELINKFILLKKMDKV